jgi:hypothetical protein
MVMMRKVNEDTGGRRGQTIALIIYYHCAVTYQWGRHICGPLKTPPDAPILPLYQSKDDHVVRRII